MNCFFVVLPRRWASSAANCCSVLAGIQKGPRPGSHAPIPVPRLFGAALLKQLRWSSSDALAHVNEAYIHSLTIAIEPGAQCMSPSVFCLDVLSNAACVGLDTQSNLQFSILGFAKALLPVILLLFPSTRWRASTVAWLGTGFCLIVMEVLGGIPRLSHTFGSPIAARNLSIASGLFGAPATLSVLAFQIYRTTLVPDRRFIQATPLGLVSLTAVVLDLIGLFQPKFQGTPVRVVLTDRPFFDALSRAALSILVIVQTTVLLLALLRVRRGDRRFLDALLAASSFFFIVQYGVTLSNLRPASLAAIKFLSLMGFLALLLHHFLVTRIPGDSDASKLGREMGHVRPFYIRPLSLLSRSSWAGLDSGVPNSNGLAPEQFSIDRLDRSRTRVVESQTDEDLESIQTPTHLAYPMQAFHGGPRLSRTVQRVSAAQSRDQSISYISPVTTTGEYADSMLRLGLGGSIKRRGRPLSFVAEVHVPDSEDGQSANRLTMATDSSYLESPVDNMGPSLMRPPPLDLSRLTPVSDALSVSASPQTPGTFGGDGPRTTRDSASIKTRNSGDSLLVTEADIQVGQRATRSSSMKRTGSLKQFESARLGSL